MKIFVLLSVAVAVLLATFGVAEETADKKVVQTMKSMAKEIQSSFASSLTKADRAKAHGKLRANEKTIFKVKAGNFIEVESVANAAQT